MKRLALIVAVLLVLGGPAAALLLVGLLMPGSNCGPAGGRVGGDVIVPETTRIVMPLPEGRYWISSRYGWRTDPVTGERAFHAGLDFAAGDGTAILAAADGIVVLTGYVGGWGNLIVLEHTVDGDRIATAYAHMWDHGTHVAEGQWVMAGDHIGDVGSSGKSTGPHLHFEVRPGGWGNPTIDPLKWLRDHDAEDLTDYIPAGHGCASNELEPTPTPTPTPTPVPSGTPATAAAVRDGAVRWAT